MEPDNAHRAASLVKVDNKRPVVATPSRLIISSIFSNVKFNLEMTMLITVSHAQDCPHAAQKTSLAMARQT